MDGISNLGEYILGTIAIILLPGPNSLYCLSVAAQYGAKAASRAIAGIILGDALLILAAISMAAVGGLFISFALRLWNSSL